VSSSEMTSETGTRLSRVQWDDDDDDAVIRCFTRLLQPQRRAAYNFCHVYQRL